MPVYKLLGAAMAAACFAQLGTATISGTVTDSSGAVLPGSDVVVVSSTTGFQRATTSNSVGEFSLPNLTPVSMTSLSNTKASKPTSRRISFC
jgi:hypothetical protein